MKLNFCLTAIINFFCCFSVAAQEFDLSKFVNETRSTARKTAYQSYFEFTHDFNRTRDKKNEKRLSENFESVCSKKRCEYILTEKNGKSLSEKAIKKNRKRAAERLEKAENLPEAKYHASKELAAGYGFMIMTSYSTKQSLFNPNLYLKNCRINFIEKTPVENRPTVKLRAAGCSVEKDENKDALQFMPETEALIWVDEQDKAVVGMDVYYKVKLGDSTVLPASPVVMMKAARVAEGYWFWKSIVSNASANETFFPKGYGDWQMEFYNFKPYTVLIDRVEIDKK